MRKRYLNIVRIVWQAQSAICISNGDYDHDTDKTVVKDHKEIPCLTGSGVAGVLFSTIPQLDDIDRVPIKIKKGNEDKQVNYRSDLYISDGYLIIGDKTVLLDPLKIKQSKWLERYTNLPIRDHVRIDHKGTADTENYGKFDNEVVYKGSRFVQDILVQSESENSDVWDALIKHLKKYCLVVGSQTRNGLGQIRAISLDYCTIDLWSTEGIATYADYNTQFSESLFSTSHKGLQIHQWNHIDVNDPIRLSGFSEPVTISLRAEDYFHFGSGMPYMDTDADVMLEHVVKWIIRTTLLLNFNTSFRHRRLKESYHTSVHIELIRP